MSLPRPDPAVVTVPGLELPPEVRLDELPATLRARDTDGTAIWITLAPAGADAQVALALASRRPPIPGLAPVRDVRVVGDVIVARLAEPVGVALEGLLVAGLSLHRFASIGEGILDVVEALHADGLCHGHLARAPVVVGPDGQPVLIGAPGHRLTETAAAADREAFRAFCLRILTGTVLRPGEGRFAEGLRRFGRIHEELDVLAHDDPEAWHAAFAALRDVGTGAGSRLRDAPIDPRELAEVREALAEETAGGLPAAHRRRRRRRRRVRRVVLVTIVLTGSLGGFWAWRLGLDPGALPGALWRPIADATSEPDAARSRAERLLARARELGDPLDAIRTYREALVFDPDNAAARREMRDLVDRLRAELSSLIRSLDLETAESLLGTYGRAIGEEELDAAGLRAALDRARTVRKHLEQARGDLAGGRLLAPPADNARFHIESVRALAPDDVNVVPILSDLVAALLERARQALARGAPAAAARDVGAASELRPEHPPVVTAQERLVDWRDQAAALRDRLVAAAVPLGAPDGVGGVPGNAGAAADRALAALAELAAAPEGVDTYLREPADRLRSRLQEIAGEAFDEAVARRDAAAATRWATRRARLREGSAGTAGAGPRGQDQMVLDRLAQERARAAALIRRAGIALEAGRLTRPSADAAVPLLLEALRLDPGAEEARMRARALAERVGELAQAARGHGLTPEAARYGEARDRLLGALERAVGLAGEVDDGP